MKNINDKNNKTNIKYYLDMDGTLAVYPDMNEPWWEVVGIFKFLAPQEKVIKAIKRLIENGQDVYILSAYNANFPNTKAEKDYWLDKYLPEIDEAHRIYTLVGQKKTDYVPGGVKITDVLLDDYNKNLEAWAAVGGTGIKLLNGLNNRNTWSGISVRANGTIKEIVEVLTNVELGLDNKTA